MLALLLLACDAETGFSHNNNDVQGSAGDALAQVTPLEIAFPPAEVGVLYAEEVVVQSLGTDDLLVYSIQVIDDATGSFSIGNDVGATTITVPPKEQTSFLVLLTLKEPTYAYATVVLQTNDADQINIQIPVSASPASGDTGDTGG